MAVRAPTAQPDGPNPLTHSLERVIHVPGVLFRRQLMVGRPNRVRHFGHVIRDARFVVHDAVALFHESGSRHDLEEALRMYTTSLLATSRGVPATLSPHDSLAEAFVAAAALGDVKLLCALFQQDLQSLGVRVDVA